MSQTTILVTGDSVQEIQTFEGSRAHASASPKSGSQVEVRMGGAHLLHQILNAARPGVATLAFEQDPKLSWPRELEAYSLYAESVAGFKADPPPPPGKKPKKVWRVSKLLGYGHTLDVPPAEPPLIRNPSTGKEYGVLLIDDGGLGFRTDRAKARWPGNSDASQPLPAWTVVKMSHPHCDSYLWRHLLEQCAPTTGVGRSRLVVVVSADELRRDGASINRGLSWERTVADTCKTLASHPQLSALTRAAHIIIVYRHEGALWVSRTGTTGPSAGRSTASLVYDPGMAEGQWRSTLRDEDNHQVLGHLSVFTAAIALELANAPDAPNFESAIQRGLTASRELRLHGHGPVGKDIAPAFPSTEVTAALNGAATCRMDHQPQDRYTICQLPGPGIEGPLDDHWVIAAQDDVKGSCTPLYGLGFQTAVYGPARLSGIPHARFGDLLSVDRSEIETLRSLRQLIEAYEQGGPQKQPLCIGAFGPPGSGKSFGIKQIAQEVMGKNVPFLEFNLSQYSEHSPEDLIGAFHQVRDVVLGGKTPVVFWDEFDSKQLHWLQFLLAPMQDGKFQSGTLTHTLGKCVFVFAGATSWDFEHFGPCPDPASAEEARELGALLAESENYRRARRESESEFRRKKGPDFISRLSGHINVLGPNRRLLFNFTTGGWDRPDPLDITFPVRRALLLRSFLKARDTDTIEIDRDLLNALIRQPRYQHGARSMERTVLPLRVQHAPLRPAQLPSPQVLEQHLDASDVFRQLLAENTDFLTPENQRKLGAAIHENYRQLTDKPYIPDPQFLGTFDTLDAWGHATNIAAAVGIPHVLAMAGLCVKPGEASEGEEDAVRRRLVRYLDPLRREEHARWMSYLLGNGWLQSPEKDPATGKPAPVRDKPRLLHTCLVPFDELSDNDKKKDHDAILSLPDAVRRVGFKIALFDDRTL